MSVQLSILREAFFGHCQPNYAAPLSIPPVDTADDCIKHLSHLLAHWPALPLVGEHLEGRIKVWFSSVCPVQGQGMVAN